MSVFDATASLAAAMFLLTYWLHSSLAVLLAGACRWAMHRWAMHRWGHPELRVLVWKFVLLLPIGTSVGVTFLGLPHFGLQLPLADSAALSPQNGRPAETLSAETLSASTSSAGFDRSAVVPSKRVLTPQPSAAELPEASLVTELESIGRGVAVEVSAASWPSAWHQLVVGCWAVGAGLGAIRLLFQLWALHQLRRKAVAITAGDALAAMQRIARRLGIRRRVKLLVSDEVSGPVVAGFVRPCILLPRSLACLGAAGEPLTGAERDALLAHELMHVARGDAWWNLIIQVVRRVFFFQPLNAMAGQQLRREMDFVADLHAALVLGQRTGLVGCLVRLAAQTKSSQLPNQKLVFTAGMASFRSTLGQRVETLLDTNNRLRPLGPRRCLAAVGLLMSGAVLLASFSPRAIGQSSRSFDTSPSNESETFIMKKQAGVLALWAALMMPVAADEPQTQTDTAAPAPAALRTTPDALPEAIRRFNGMLVGRLAAKDIERGTFVVNVDTVSRVWRNSQAENPHSLVGKAVEVGGVSGKWLDVLVTTRTGETIEFECQHDGDGLRFPGELLRKVAPYEPQNYPRLPAAFRGFQGAIVAEIVKKDPESFELLVKVSDVSKVWPSNQAPQPESIRGQSMLLTGFWNRREIYQSLKPGDRIEAGIQHISRQSDHVNVHEFVRKASGAASEKMERMTEAQESAAANGQGVQGFRGMLVGRLVSKDIERGTFRVTVDAVTRVWNNNKSRNPKSLIGQHVEAVGTQGKMLDTLVVTRVGETIEFGALHDGDHELRVGEVLRKVAPVKPGDYPEIPDAARGIVGMITAKVVNKDQEMWGLVIEVQSIEETFPKSRATDPESLVGKRATLTGFWNRKDAYQSLNVGDTVRLGVDHQQPLSDALSVIESIRKLETE